MCSNHVTHHVTHVSEQPPADSEQDMSMVALALECVAVSCYVYCLKSCVAVVCCSSVLQ